MSFERFFLVDFRAVLVGGLLGSAVLVGAGCSTEEVKPDLPPILGTLELPIAHRTSGTEPRDATRVEIGTSEIRINGETGLMLESNGKVSAAEVQGNLLTKIKAKLGEKRVLAISTHAATPYATLALVMNTALSSGAKELAFRVRKPGTNTDTGWLLIKDNRFTASAEQASFQEQELPPWDSFTKVWEDAVDACQASQRGDCGYKPLAKAEGGKLDLMLRARGTGLALRFRQTGVPVPTEAPKPVKKAVEMLEGIKAAPAAEEVPPEPSTEHVFTLRADQATVTPSPISGIMKTVCGTQSCPAVIDAEPLSMSGRVIALIGAAFPDGAPEPRLSWVLSSK